MKGYAREPSYDLRAVELTDVAHLFAEHHPYKSTGRVCVAAYAVFEGGVPVSAFL